MQNNVYYREPAKLSDHVHFTWIDYSVFVAMLIISSVFGVYFGFKDYQRSKHKTKAIVEVDEMMNYLVGNRKMHAFPVGFSLIATWISALVLMGTTGETYLFGANYSLMIFGTISLGLH
jgi:Na+/proline symporter